MSYIVTRLCRDCIDTACTAVCPVSCIYRYEGDDKEMFPNQLCRPEYIWFDRILCSAIIEQPQFCP